LKVSEIDPTKTQEVYIKPNAINLASVRREKGFIVGKNFSEGRAHYVYVQVGESKRKVLLCNLELMKS
jgi:hypothetical protein